MPGANIGLACGPSGLVVIDLDGGDGLETWEALRLAHGFDDGTLCSATATGCTSSSRPRPAMRSATRRASWGRGWTCAPAAATSSRRPACIPPATSTPGTRRTTPTTWPRCRCPKVCARCWQPAVTSAPRTPRRGSKRKTKKLLIFFGFFVRLRVFAPCLVVKRNWRRCGVRRRGRATPRSTAPRSCWARTWRPGWATMRRPSPRCWLRRRPPGCPPARRAPRSPAASAGAAANSPPRTPRTPRGPKTKSRTKNLPNLLGVLGVLRCLRGASAPSPWLDAYIAYSRAWSPRAPASFHEACGLWLLSTIAARRVVTHLGSVRYGNLYLALTGAQQPV